MAALSHLSALLLVLFCAVHQSDAAWCETIATGTDCDPNCNVVVSCQALGVWTNRTNCLSSGRVCYNGECVTNPPDFCTRSPQVMDCDSATSGWYPYPYDCTTYFDCTTGGLMGEPKKCVGSRFNPCTQDCSLSLTNGACPASSVPTCTYVNQQIEIPGADSYYYQCYRTSAGTFGLRLERCSSGSRYSARTGQCEDVGDISGCTVCPSGSAGPRAHGRTNCRYIWCYSQTEFIVRQCTTGWHFEATQGGCVHGACS